jgi:hypothetical protein
MQTEAKAIPVMARHPEAGTCVKIIRPSVLGRFRHFITSTNWDENILRREKWIDRICLDLVVLSVLYFVPVLLSTLLK